MQEISISEFKAKCVALIDQVSKTKKPLRISRHRPRTKGAFYPETD